MPDTQRLRRRALLRHGGAWMLTSGLLTLGCGHGARRQTASRGAAPDGSLVLRFDDRLADVGPALEARVGGRVGVAAVRHSTGQVASWRADERFAMASTFKWALAAAWLRRCDQGKARLDDKISFGHKDLLEPTPIAAAHVEAGFMTLEDMCAAIVTHSDNTAANLLLDALGGPPAWTAFMRELGDSASRLDRREPELNLNVKDDARDTTTPRAMAGALDAAVHGGALSRASVVRLASWLEACVTGTRRLRGGLPPGLLTGDKTGTGMRGACNDVAVVTLADGTAWTLACYLSGSEADLAELEAVHVEVARVFADVVARGPA